VCIHLFVKFANAEIEFFSFTYKYKITYQLMYLAEICID